MNAILPSQTKLFRNTGIAYLVVVATGIFSLAYVPKQLVDWESEVSTFQNLLAKEMLFRHSIAAGIVCYIAFTLLALLFYRMLAPVHAWYAKAMAALALLSVPMSLANLQHKFVILGYLKSARENSDSVTQLSRQAMEQLEHYQEGILVVTVFWGLWLLPLGYLIFRSGFLPKLLGLLLMLGCVGYMVNLFGYTLLVNYPDLGLSSIFGMFPAVAEIGTCVWLLLIGFKIIPLKK
jgi:hypothetical protein